MILFVFDELGVKIQFLVISLICILSFLIWQFSFRLLVIDDRVFLVYLMDEFVELADQIELYVR